MRGWLLDTNVLSELSRPSCDAGVARWAEAQPEDQLFISVLSLGEYDQGIANLPPGSLARPRLEASVAALERRFGRRVISVSDAVVRRWGRISGAVQQQTGRRPPVIDTLLAASAIEHDLGLATRNIRDVELSGATLADPWRT